MEGIDDNYVCDLCPAKERVGGIVEGITTL
jgi:hypothetical protein